MANLQVNCSNKKGTLSSVSEGQSGKQAVQLGMLVKMRRQWSGPSTCGAFSQASPNSPASKTDLTDVLSNQGKQPTHSVLLVTEPKFSSQVPALGASVILSPSGKQINGYKSAESSGTETNND